MTFICCSLKFRDLSRQILASQSLMKLIYYYDYYYYYSGTPNGLYPFYGYNKTFWEHCVFQRLCLNSYVRAGGSCSMGFIKQV